MDKFTRELKAFAIRRGADLVGIVAADVFDSFPKHWIGWKIKAYSEKIKEIMPDAKSVVVVGYHVWDDVFEVAVRKRGQDWHYPGYSPLTILTHEITSYLQSNGYRAVASSSPDEPLFSRKRLAQLAGFGAFGKNSLIINPKFGPWVRFDALPTNAELVPDKPFEQDLCGDCNRCEKACPVKALTNYNVDADRCLVGIHLINKEASKYKKVLNRFEPSLTKRSHLMCRICQKVCKYGRKA